MELVATFLNPVEAEVVAGRLREAGIPAVVLADTAGGAYPSLGYVRGTRVMVPAEHGEEARTLLEDPATG